MTTVFAPCQNHLAKKIIDKENTPCIGTRRDARIAAEHVGNLPPIYYIAGSIAAASTLIGIGMWIGGINHHKSAVVAFMQEIRNDIKKIFDRLPLASVVGNSPLRLTELGETISKTLSVAEWAERIAGSLVDRTKGKPPYEVQNICGGYIYDEFKPDSDQDPKIKACAYENGLDERQVLDVLVVELRDRLLEAER